MNITIKDIRVSNARSLRDKEAGGNNQQFCDRVGATNRQQVANWIGKTPIRTISDATARQIERGFGRPVGWLDRDHSQDERRPDSVIISAIRAGNEGRLPGVVDSAIRQIDASMDWVRKNAGRAAPENLSVATIDGDAMRDSMPDGSMVLIDRSASDLKVDGVYMLAAQAPSGAARVWFRRCHRALDGKWHLTAENPAIQTEVISSLKTARLVVLGRVIVVLEARRV